MSYDFKIFRAPHELSSLQQIVSAEVLAPGDWRADAQRMLAEAVPGLVWSAEAGTYDASCSDQRVGRFDLHLGSVDGVTMASIRGSHHANQLALVRSCAEAIGGYAFDMQTCERIWPECEVAT